jgi:RHS repeat-associated protein
MPVEDPTTPPAQPRPLGSVQTRQPVATAFDDRALTEGDARALDARAVDLLPKLTRPTGGGAVRGIGEKFSANPQTGMATLSVPLALSPGRGGFTPGVSLAYDSSTGNGAFGFGWALHLPAITRKTDKGIPRYRDDDESDVFILAGAEDLVPVLDASGQRVRATRTVYGVTYDVFAYQPRVEGGFARVERWVATDTMLSHWRTISPDNVTTLYGIDAGSRVADPADPRRIFSYHLSQSWDDQGNVAVYDYVSEDDTGIDLSRAHEANRTTAGRAAQRYLRAIRYGNIQPYAPTWSDQGTEPPLPADWAFQVVLDYGDHAPDAPKPVADRPWSIRPDPFSSYRAGFEMRMYRRVSRILIFHNFPAEPTVGVDGLVRSYDLVYSDQMDPTDPRNPIYTLLVSITHTGYVRAGDGYTSRSMPALEMDYSTPQLQPDVRTLDTDSATNVPEGLDGMRYRWVDLDGEGLPGVLTDVGGAWRYKRNLSPLGADARLGPLDTVTVLPSRNALGDGQWLMDLSGAGQLDVVEMRGGAPGFFKRTADERWEPFRPFAALPDIDWTDANVTLVDLTGDGRADVLFTEEGVFTFYPSRGDHGFGHPELVRTPWDEEQGPTVILADGTQTIFLADMSGDGLNDLVRVRTGEVCYWPNLGYGRFGAKVTMDDAPRFVDEERFDPRRVRLADIDGSGTTDLLYIGDDGVTVCFNQSGNAWATPTTIAVFPSADRLSTVEVIDLMGTGTACLVWSSPLPGAVSGALRYVDLMGGQKPHLLATVRNNLGAETRVTYAPSTRFYLEDRIAGRPWITRLPHPVQVVSRCESIDWIGRNRAVTRYAYHHGHFDGYEREFRGFGMVEQWDTEEYRTDIAFPDGDALNWDQTSWSPPMRTCTWFHTGALDVSFASEYWTGDGDANRLPDTAPPAGLAAHERREAYRALTGKVLRTEVYAEDGSPRAGSPYTVIEQNYTVRMLQSTGPNRHAVFFVHAREGLTANYDRQPADPRLSHQVTLEVDDYGNVLRQVAVGYPRRPGYAPPEPTLPTDVQARLAYDQTRLRVMATQSMMTNALTDRTAYPDLYRLPLAAESIGAELTGITPASNRFAFEELDAIWTTVWDGAHDVPYEAIPISDVDGAGVPATTPTRRVVSQTRTLYRSDDLTMLLAPRVLQPRALGGESYRAAFTPGQLSAIYGGLVNDATLGEGGYVQLAGDARWWIPSGRLYLSPNDGDTPAQELAAAEAHFWRARRATDAFGASAHVDYDAYDLLVVATTDAVGNVTSAQSDYRVLSPAVVTEPNGNRAAVAFDAFGLIVGTAAMGKVGETVGDSLAGFVTDLDEATALAHIADPLSNPGAILGNASARLVYDLNAYARTRTSAQPSPPVVCSLTRLTHVSDLASGQETAYQHELAYSDGFARVIQRKVQAPPGPVVEDGPTVTPRWIGSGWTIFNNKSNPVRQYEPFYTATSAFEFAAQVGVSTITFYDAPARIVATLRPDNTWDKEVTGGWRRERWDGNDTVLIADPRTDADVGDHFQRLLGTAAGAFISWHDQRIGGAYGPADQDAAQKAAAHAGTPAVAHLDALGRLCLTIADNGGGTRLTRRLARDGTARPLSTTDALGRAVVELFLRTPSLVAGADMAGRTLYSMSMDSGAGRALPNVANDAIRAWDVRGHAFRSVYDRARRLTHVYVSTSGGAEALRERIVYGEGLAADNLAGQAVRHYDSAGVAITARCDFKGNVVSGARQLALDYHGAPDWMPLATLTDLAALDAAAGPLLAADQQYANTTLYDALSRPTQTVSPYNASMRPNVTQLTYNETGQVMAVDAWLRVATPPTGLLPAATADRHAITAITFNALGFRTATTFGNGTVTAYAFDPVSLRLTGITTTRPGSFADDQRVVQQLRYAYDPVGNITRIDDQADLQDTIFFRNQRVEPSTDYTYDPTYQLTVATGREHLPSQQVTNDDSARSGLTQPGDGTAMGTYTERYTYDAVGNFLSVAHQAAAPWTRRYTYDHASNRLLTTSVPGDPDAGPYTATYSYDAHGNMTRMPHLSTMTWDERDRLASTARQAVTAGLPETTFYVYGSAGGRIRKTTDAQAAAGSTTGVRAAERIYLGAVELYREFAADGTTVTLEREMFHVHDGAHPIAFIETRTIGTDSAPAQVTRYQHGNHLGSAALELDDHAGILTYEEFYPYGSTSYEAQSGQTDTPKRYRFADKERDSENDLYYCEARYYASWLGRWISPDPAGIVGGIDVYAYVRANPVRLIDPTGRQGWNGTGLGADPFTGMASREWDTLVETTVGGHATSVTPDHMIYEEPKGGPGGIVGGVVSAVTLRCYPTERNPNANSAAGLDFGGSMVPILSPAEELITGTTVTGQPVSRVWAAVGLVGDVSMLSEGGEFSRIGEFGRVGEAGSVEAREANLVSRIGQDERYLADVAKAGEEATARQAAKAAGVKPPPTPGSTKPLSDQGLIDRAAEINRDALKAFLQSKGKSVRWWDAWWNKRMLTVAVLQGSKGGKLVTLVAGQTKELSAFIKAVLRPGEEFVEAVQALPDNLRTGLPRSSGGINVHAEQLAAGEAKVRGITTGRVATSKPGCQALCVSNLAAEYPGITHVNPAPTPPPPRPPARPAR